VGRQSARRFAEQLAKKREPPALHVRECVFRRAPARFIELREQVAPFVRDRCENDAAVIASYRHLPGEPAGPAGRHALVSFQARGMG
jgi:hypothetical protein